MSENLILSKEVLTQQTYSPVGSCIYCGKHHTGVPGNLSREHVVPFSLKGEMILPAASCRTCANETHAFEGRCAGTMLINARHFLGLPRNAKHKKRKPMNLPYAFRKGPDGKNIRVEIPIEDYPPFFTLPILEASTFSKNEPPSQSLRMTGIGTYLFDSMHEKWSKLPRDVQLASPFRVDDITRLYSKIAHGIACAEVGRDSFDAFLPKVILGSSDRVLHYVGGTDIEPEPMDDALHAIRLTVQSDGTIFVYVRLFARFVPLTYEIAVGKLQS